MWTEAEIYLPDSSICSCDCEAHCWIFTIKLLPHTSLKLTVCESKIFSFIFSESQIIMRNIKGTVYQFVRVNGKVFHLPSLQRRKLNYYAKDQRMWTEAEIYLITYSNLALPPPPLGRNFKEKHFEN